MLKNSPSKSIDLFLGAYAVLFLVASFFIPPMHDYALYFAHWDLTLSGGDPWAKIPAPNAYGPVYNFFALPYALHSQLPKLMFVACWLAIVIVTVRNFFSLESVSHRLKWGFAAFWLLNPFFIVSTAFYGFNDSFVALLCFAGILVAAESRSKTSLILFTVGVLTKLYPLFLLPFLDTKWRKIGRNILLFFAILLSVYAITYMIWGSSFLVAFGKANGRNPTLLSIMMFFHGNFFPFESLSKFLISLNKPLTLLAIIFVFWRYKKGKLEQHAAFLAGFTALLMFYKAGQQQFYLAYFAMFAAWVIIEFRRKHPNFGALYAVIALGVWMMAMAGLVYPLTSMQGEYLWVRHIIGLPTFVLLCIVFHQLLFPSSKAIKADHE